MFSEREMALTMVYIVIAVIVSIIALCIVTAIFMQHFERSHKKRKGSSIIGELAHPKYKKVFTLDARFLILIGRFGDNLPDDKFINTDSWPSPENDNVTKFFNALHNSSITSPDDHERCILQLCGVILDRGHTNSGVIYSIEGYKTKTTPSSSRKKISLIKPDNKYNYRTAHMLANKNKQFTTGKYNLKPNTDVSEFYDPSEKQYIDESITEKCDPTDERKIKFRKIIDYLAEIILQQKIHIKCLCI
jgi:hypothetical protein